MSLTRRQNLNYFFFFAFSIATIFLILSVNPATAEKLVLEEYGDPILQVMPAQTLLINGTGIFLTTGDSWEFYQGYVVTVKSVNIDTKKVWVKLLNEDQLLKERIVSEGETFVYSKDDGAEIINLTLDTIYISPEGELVTFKPVYQYRDYDLPEPVIEEDEENTTQDNETGSQPSTNTNQTGGFTLLQVIAVTCSMIVFRSIFRK